MRSLSIIILVIIIFSLTSVYAIRESEFTEDGYVIVYPDNPDMAADYKMNYAMMNPEEFSKSKILIYDYDTQFVERALKIAQESCAQKGTANCADTVKGYQDALATLNNMKAQQSGRKTETTSNPSPAPIGGEKAKTGTLGQLKNWLKDVKDFLAKLLTGWRP